MGHGGCVRIVMLGCYTDGDEVYHEVRSDINPGRTPNPMEASNTAPCNTVDAGVAKKWTNAAISEALINRFFGNRSKNCDS